MMVRKFLSEPCNNYIIKQEIDSSINKHGIVKTERVLTDESNRDYNIRPSYDWVDNFCLGRPEGKKAAAKAEKRRLKLLAAEQKIKEENLAKYKIIEEERRLKRIKREEEWRNRQVEFNNNFKARAERHQQILDFQNEIEIRTAASFAIEELPKHLETIEDKMAFNFLKNRMEISGELKIGLKLIALLASTNYIPNNKKQ